MTTTTHLPGGNQAVAEVLNGHRLIDETYCTAETLAQWYVRYPGLEFSVTGRTAPRTMIITVARRDTSLRIVPITRTEPQHLSPDGEGPNDGRRSWECAVGFGSTNLRLRGFPTKIECTLAARGWFVAYGICPDSPGGWA